MRSQRNGPAAPAIRRGKGVEPEIGRGKGGERAGQIAGLPGAEANADEPRKAPVAEAKIALRRDLGHGEGSGLKARQGAGFRRAGPEQGREKGERRGPQRPVTRL